MTAGKNYLQILSEQIHTVVMATVDEQGHPVTQAIDLMAYDEKTVYFLTAEGKPFCAQLRAHPWISLTGLSGGEGYAKSQASLHMQSITLRGKVQELGKTKIAELFEQNPYMKQIYPSETSRQVLTVFCLAQGQGEYFDLSTEPITRETFRIGSGETDTAYGYVITEACTGCGQCAALCPQNCIDDTQMPYRIESAHCLQCGLCAEICPAEAVRNLSARS